MDGGGDGSSSAAVIRRIDRNTVHRICSGQVVLSLAVAIKELVENALDANATIIEIRLKEYGSELIEVIDNGCGVEEKDFQNLTKKHCTSKLKEFEDLTSVDTFGFRGEALSSLCALSKIIIITCHEKSSVGTILEYDHCGNILKKAINPRQTGTTVRIENLFSTLPVRHREFTKNLKREFAKAVNMLYGYCLVVTGKRIVCTNIVGKLKNQVISINASKSMRESILDTFGSKQLDSLVEIMQCPPSETVIEEYFLKDSSKFNDFFRINGFISVATHGHGRSTSDRQFCSINGRPCDLPKVTKIVNEVYHCYNKHQYPFLLLNISLKRNAIDLNVTPDKRQIFFENEKLLLAIIKTSLIELYGPRTSQLEVSSPIMSTFSLRSTPTSSPGLTQLKRDFSFVSERKDLLKSPVAKQPRLDSFLLNITRNDNSVMKSVENSTSSSPSPSTTEVAWPKRKLDHDLSDITELSTPETPCHAAIKLDKCKKRIVTPGKSKERLSEVITVVGQSSTSSSTDFPLMPRNVKKIQFSMNDLREKMRKNKIEFNENAEKSERKFRAEIKPSSNNDAEQELKREIHREMFPKMDIIGQFNLGFIIAKLNSDLFIIDQHATDEKYNYETLQKTTVLETQKLISPQSLDLSMANETLLIENLEIFRMNGFEFEINNSGKTNRRISLSSIPISKNWTFGKQDIEEMLFMLSDSPQGIMCRPSRVQQMFASRACRKSIMIGTPLTSRDMKKLVTHMAEMDQPWNCPHGRPTMRHLLTLTMI